MLHDGGVRLAGPRAELTPELVEEARAHKAELLAYLRARQVDRFCEEHRIEASIGAAILKIEEHALALGWSYDRLWNAEFWPHAAEHPRGLASVSSPGDSLGEVTCAFIVIHKADRQRQRFMRLDT